MKEYESNLLRLLSKALFGRDVELQNQDWLMILKEAKSQAVVQLADSVIDKSILSLEETSQWKQASSVDIANNIRVGHNHSQLHEWMTDIPYVSRSIKSCVTDKLPY